MSHGRRQGRGGRAGWWHETAWPRSRACSSGPRRGSAPAGPAWRCRRSRSPASRARAWPRRRAGSRGRTARCGPPAPRPLAHSRNAGSTAGRAGAVATMASVIPVSTAMNGGTLHIGLTRVWNSPSRSPPRTLTAPISVIADSAGEPPVVSRSTTTKVTSASGTPSSSKVPWSAIVWPRAGRSADSPVATRPAVIAVTVGAVPDKFRATRRDRSTGGSGEICCRTLALASWAVTEEAR